MRGASSFPLLQKAEELIGIKHFDPILLLLLGVDDTILKKQTCFGVKFLTALQPILGQRSALLDETKKYIQDFLIHEMDWRLSSKHMPQVQYKPKKVDLLSQQNTVCSQAICPTLFQIVYRYVFMLCNVSVLAYTDKIHCSFNRNSRRHCLAPKWVDALHTEMLELLLDESELPPSYSSRGSRRPLQVCLFTFF